MKSLTTEEKIKSSAKLIFTKKGYVATRTRDIADEAGINLSLLNYYYRSKEKLFTIIMEEQIEELFGTISNILVEDLSFEQTVINVIDNYFEILENNQDLAIFILNEIRGNSTNSIFKSKLKSIFANHKIDELISSLNLSVSNYHFLMNLIGMILFPFISKPIFIVADVITDNDFKKLIKEQKAIIIKFIETFLKNEK